MADSSIEWTDKVWNVTRGCSRVSPGCGGAAGQGGCYAERQAFRFAGPGMPYEGLVRLGKQGPRWTGQMRLVREKLDEPSGWKKSCRIFVNSMSDLFHEALSNEQIAAVFGVMAQCPRHTFQVLTKRAERMRRWFEWVARFEQEHGPPPDEVVTIQAVNFGAEIDQLQRPWPLPNVWLGVSAESQEYADERIPELLQTPAAVRFVSYEPALGPINFEPWLAARVIQREYPPPPTILSTTPGLDWVIVGGESGPGARPFDTRWAEATVAACERAGVACFVKQLGARPFEGGLLVTAELHPKGCHFVEQEETSEPLHLRAKKGGDMAEWPEHLRVRQFPRAEVAHG